MIKELANVVAIDSTQVTVTSQIKSGCSGCAQVDTCGSGQISKALPQAKLTLTLPLNKDTLQRNLSVGDCVVLALPEKYMLASAGQVYLMPLFGLISFSGLGQLLYQQNILSHELFALGLGLVGAYLGFRVAKYQQKEGVHSKKLQPQIIDVIPSQLR